MTLRLTDEETQLLRELAEHEHRSMHAVVQLAIRERHQQAAHQLRVRAAIDRVVAEDREILDTLRDL